MRMRTMLLTPLLLIPILLTSASLLLLRQQMQRQIRESIAADLRHSTATYRNLEQQRRAALAREALLLAYQTSLGGVFTTRDPGTFLLLVGAYAQLSGADLCALLSADGKVDAVYGATPEQLAQIPEGDYFFDGKRLFAIAVQPIYFGSSKSGSVLGYVLVGSQITDAVAHQVSQTAGVEIAFALGTKIVSNTLDSQGLQSLSSLATNAANLDWKGQRFLVDRVPLSSKPGIPIKLVVMLSMQGFQQTLRRLNRIVLLIGLTTSLAGVALAFWVARRLTSPLEGLAAGVAAVGAGNYLASLPHSGSSEIHALSGAIETMRAQIRETQARLIAAERLATIGQMASSVSHDLRHYLSSVYANAEFLAAPNLSYDERTDLLAEIHLSVQGTTDLIESLLLFTRTGRVLHLSCESVTDLAERAIHRLSQHPEAVGIAVELDSFTTAEASVDARKIERAIYNLLLNGCQAARQSPGKARVKVEIHEEAEMVRVEVSDSGPGVSASIRDCLFDPFVSANKENGIGLGLTLAAAIAQEHGGTIRLQGGDGLAGPTVFVFTLSRQGQMAPQPASPDAAKGARL